LLKTARGMKEKEANAVKKRYPETEGETVGRKRFPVEQERQ